MATTVHVSLVEFSPAAAQGVLPTVARSTQFGTGELLATTGSSQLATLQANTATVGNVDPQRLAWRVAVHLTPSAAADRVHVVCGTGSPTATNAGFLCPPGTVNFFGVSVIGERLAILGPA